MEKIRDLKTRDHQTVRQLNNSATCCPKDKHHRQQLAGPSTRDKWANEQHGCDEHERITVQLMHEKNLVSTI